MKHKTSSIAVDIIVENSGKVLLIKRNEEPFIGKLALPGGHVEYNERVEDAAIREMKEETGFLVKPIHILGVYSARDRDPRIHTITICFISSILGGKFKPNEEVKEVKWVNLNQISRSKMAFDHKKIINDYLKWKRNKKTYWSSKGP